MKLLRYKEDSIIKPGILDSKEKIRDASSIIDDWNSETISIDNLKKIMKLDLTSLPEASLNVSVAPCVANVGNSACRIESYC